MKKILVCVFVIVMLLCNTACSNRRILVQNSDVIAYYVNDHSNHINEVPLATNTGSYDLKVTFGNLNYPPRLLYLITIEKVDNVELLYHYHDFDVAPKETDKDAIWLQNSIVTARVETVFFDPRENPAHAGEQIVIYSTNSIYSDDQNPILQKGDRYYITVQDTDLIWPASYDNAFWACSYYREIADYYALACGEHRWKLDENGKVYVIPHLIQSRAHETAYEMGQEYEVYFQNDFEDDLISLLAPYQELWKEAEIVDIVEAIEKQNKHMD